MTLERSQRPQSNLFYKTNFIMVAQRHLFSFLCWLQIILNISMSVCFNFKSFNLRVLKCHQGLQTFNTVLKAQEVSETLKLFKQLLNRNILQNFTKNHFIFDCFFRFRNYCSNSTKSSFLLFQNLSVKLHTAVQFHYQIQSTTNQKQLTHEKRDFISLFNNLATNSSTYKPFKRIE